VDGETGFICDTLREMVEAVERVGTLDRAACRRRVEERFSGTAMADGYEAVYTRLLAGDEQPERNGHTPLPLADRLLR